MVEGWTAAGEHSPLGKAPKLPLGGYGWVFGYDNNYENHHFKGISMRTENKDGTAWFSAENYRVIVRYQLYSHEHFDKKAEAMCDAVLGKPADTENEMLPELIENGFILCKDGILSANFPVFKKPVFDKLPRLLRPIVEMVSECMIEISEKAASILAEHAPASVRSQCADIAKIHHRLDVMAFLFEKMVENRKLMVPKEKTNLCIFGVKTNS